MLTRIVIAVLGTSFAVIYVSRPPTAFGQAAASRPRSQPATAHFNDGAVASPRTQPADKEVFLDEKLLVELIAEMAWRSPHNWIVDDVDTGPILLPEGTAAAGHRIGFYQMPFSAEEDKSPKRCRASVYFVADVPASQLATAAGARPAASRPAATATTTATTPASLARQIGTWHGMKVLLLESADSWPGLQEDLAASLRVADGQLAPRRKERRIWWVESSGYVYIRATNLTTGKPVFGDYYDTRMVSEGGDEVKSVHIWPFGAEVLDSQPDGEYLACIEDTFAKALVPLTKLRPPEGGALPKGPPALEIWDDLRLFGGDRSLTLVKAIWDDGTMLRQLTREGRLLISSITKEKAKELIQNAAGIAGGFPMQRLGTDKLPMSQIVVDAGGRRMVLINAQTAHEHGEELPQNGRERQFLDQWERLTKLLSEVRPTGERIYVGKSSLQPVPTSDPASRPER